MVSQPKQTTYSPLVGPAALPAGTVEYGRREPRAPPLTLALIERGQERYRIYCAPCHSELGDGRGMIVERGFPPPPSFHIERLRNASPQYFYDVIARGHGVMYSFADRVEPDDRWAIAAYIRALQRSEGASPADVPAPEHKALP
jgi:mono/diheme cytochrome c family protein